MSLSLSFNFAYLSRTAVYEQNGSTEPSAQLTTTHTSANLQVKLFPRWYKHVAVEWAVPPDWGNCRFNVYFCQSEDGPFEKLNGQPINGTYLLDIETREIRKFSKGYYVVEAILLDKNSVAIRSKATTWHTNQRRWVQLRSDEIQRREYWLLSKVNGVKSYLFRRKSYGERCPECWNHDSEKRIKDNCTTCYGASFKGGYFPAAPLYLNYDPSNDAMARTYFGKFEPEQLSAWTISYPEIRSDDVIIRSGDWHVYRVDRVAATELQANTVRQILQLTQLSKTDIENELMARDIAEYPDKYK